VQQHLVSIGFDLRAAEATVSAGQADLKQRLCNTAEELAGILSELQEISRGLHPAVLSKSGLDAALKMLARRSPVPVELHEHLSDRLPEQVEVTIYYIVCEALTNVLKHANASTVRVDLEKQERRICLSIRDDGCGGADLECGSGLIGLNDRVEALEGAMQVESPAGEGTSLRITIPV
jgi:signal transduction histidine kinase